LTKLRSAKRLQHNRRPCTVVFAGGDVANVLFAALFGGFALGQAAPNLQYFAQASDLPQRPDG